MQFCNTALNSAPITPGCHSEDKKIYARFAPQATFFGLSEVHGPNPACMRPTSEDVGQPSSGWKPGCICFRCLLGKEQENRTTAGIKRRFSGPPLDPNSLPQCGIVKKEWLQLRTKSLRDRIHCRGSFIYL